MIVRYILAILALGGAAVSVLALQVYYSTETVPCSIYQQWDCDLVNHSPYAEVEGVPVAALGIAGYLMLAMLALTRQRMLVFFAAFIGLGVAFYFAHIENAILMTWCVYGEISQGIIAIIALLSLWWMVTWKMHSKYESGRTELG